jgi:hypothetical protein
MEIATYLPTAHNNNNKQQHVKNITFLQNKTNMHSYHKIQIWTKKRQINRK